MTGVPLNIDWQQILLHLFNFTILFAIMFYLLYKPIKNFMKKREDYYLDMDNKAKETLESAEHIKKEYKDRMHEIEEEIRAKKEKTRLELEKASARKIKDASEQASRIIAKAKSEADVERQKIINGAQAEISAMVAEATEKLTLEATTSEAFDQFLDATERGYEDERIK